MQSVCGFVCGFAAASAQPQSRSVLTKILQQKRNKEKERVRPLCRYNTLKTTRTRQCKASCEQRLRAGKRANFSAAKNLPFCTSKTKEIHKIFKGRKSLIIFSKTTENYYITLTGKETYLENKFLLMRSF